MAENNAGKIGQRLMVHVIDDVAQKDPERKVCTMPERTDSADAFVDLNFRQLAHAVNYMSWWIEKSFGRNNGSPQETLTYLGANDSRYLIMVMACNKTGYQPLLSSTRNSQAAQLRLFEMTDCLKLAYSSERKQKAEEIEERRSDLKSAQIPSLAEMLANPTELYPFTKTFDEVKNDVAFIAHSSGTTGFPKPIRLTYGYFGALDHGAYVPIPEGRTAGVPDRLTPNDLILSTTPFFHMMGFSLMIMTVFHGIPCVILPDKPLSTELLTTTLNSTKPTAALFPPCILEDMAADPESMDALSRLKSVYFGGGPLSPEVGRTVSQRTKLVSFLGMTEGGFVLSFVPEDREDWSYFEWSPTFGIKMEPIGEGELAEMVIHRHERPDLQPIFHTFPDLPAYHTKDLYSPHPTKLGLWKFHGRLDDVIVLNNGEKFNPVTMEKIIEGHPLVARAVVVGLGRFQTALIVEPNWSQEVPDENQFIEEIWPTVQEANRISVAHGRVMKDKIGVASRDKPFSTTPKGSTQRRLVTDSYKDEIEALYSKRASADAWVDAISGATELSDIVQTVRNMVSEAISLSPAEFTDQMDLYSIGLDSLQTLRLSTILQVAGLKTVTPQMIYAHPSVEKLSNLLHGIVHGVQIEESATARSERIDSLVKKYTADLRQPDVKGYSMCNGTDTKKHVVILTGSTGSLGTYLFNNLLNDSRVSKIYCLNRTNAQERQIESFKQKGLTSLEGPQADKVEFHTVSLHREHFGLPDITKYTEMLSTVDTVIHNAWRMDFNISVDSFQDQIQAVRRLVNFCTQSTHHAHFYFMSSIGAIGEWKRSDGDTVPEEPFESCNVALRQGYGEAKHVCERVCLAATKQAGVSTTILRLGQIAGPTTEAGMWNPWEWLPTIVKTSKAIGKIPRTLGAAPVDWIPVDTLSTIIQDLIHTRQSPNPQSSCAVFHLINPESTTWAHLLPSIQKTYRSTTIEPVEMSEWIEELERIEKPTAEDLAAIPALKLLGFYKSLVQGEGALSVPLCVERTKEASRTMQGLGAISEKLMGNWLRQWGF